MKRQGKALSKNGTSESPSIDMDMSRHYLMIPSGTYLLGNGKVRFGFITNVLDRNILKNTVGSTVGSTVR